MSEIVAQKIMSLRSMLITELNNLGVRNMLPFKNFLPEPSNIEEWPDVVFCCALIVKITNQVFYETIVKHKLPLTCNARFLDSTELYIDTWSYNKDKAQKIKVIFSRITRLIINVLFPIESISRKPGVKVIHRIWVGKTPSQDILTSIAAANLKIQAFWPNSGSAKCYLWTDCHALLNNSRNTYNFEVRHINELLNISSLQKNDPRLFETTRSLVNLFIGRSFFAHAVDLLRLLALYKYGGLYLDFGFIFPHVWHGLSEIPFPYQNQGRETNQHIEAPMISGHWFEPSENDFLVTRAPVLQGSFHFDSSVFSENTADIGQTHYGITGLENGMLYSGKKESRDITFALKQICSQTAGFNDITKRYPLLLDKNHHFKNLHLLMDLEPLAHTLVNCGRLAKIHFKVSLNYNDIPYPTPSKFHTQEGRFYCVYFEVDKKSLFIVDFTSNAKNPYELKKHSSYYYPIFQVSKKLNSTWVFEKTDKKSREI
ncbi:glycosyltransferase [Pelagibaculum spongiae]|uniref:Uncharacterized protein n=1 Tax=Pelagibaculum spongiae TaxID=2080658 RepID=A0A2V1H4J2_9GAMM|nr:glycosyltransferase [Pelagibaculum spongiae]PVZ70556.1 hypothetical protein DC094_08215 [Pelagibaculum spongiae]